ncbi:hypothetical protein [Halohasta litorea]|uniref:Uncharacterized protein n=1 Tax=Halohasta litorea TaxID=869891 RepID=A0ABD6D8N2_9EURY|nr:hypothetical protein [Halohasta litorea]
MTDSIASADCQHVSADVAPELFDPADCSADAERGVDAAPGQPAGRETGG